MGLLYITIGLLLKGRNNMLLLTRRLGEKIKIGSNGEISILVTGIRGMQVSLAIDAPKDIPIHREEVYQRIQQEKQFDDKV